MDQLDAMGESALLERLRANSNRRTFLRWSGMTAAVIGLAACDDGDNPVIPEPEPEPEPEQPAAVTLDFSSDVGVLNYAYALEQLEAAFYTMVVANFFQGATEDERIVLTDLRDHEVAHREFLAAALGTGAIGALTPNFDAVDFSSRASVLGTAQTFEDLGVSAYNGAGIYLSSPDLLTVAGKIVSVEARHASVIRNLNASPFAPDEFDPAAAPGEVLAAAAPFIENSISTTGL